MADYSYQTPLINNCITHLKNGEKTVLAAAPGSGKTNMAIRIIDALLAAGAVKKVLVLAHGQTVLRQQFADVLHELGNATYGVLGQDIEAGDAATAVEVGLPHYFVRRLEDPAFAMPSYDLLVVDEAHHFYDAEMVQNIRQRCGNIRELLLTGSPSPFIRENNKKPQYVIEATTVQECLDAEVMSDPWIELVQTGITLKSEDYSADEDVRESVNIPMSKMSAAIDAAMDKLLEMMLQRAQSRVRDPKKYYSDSMYLGDKLAGARRWSFFRDELKKTMIICRRQDQAQLVKKWFESKNIDAALSTSDIDTDSSEITRFRNDIECKVLVVVHRATLGFNMPELMNVVDLSLSHNPDRLFQALCRVVRVNPADTDRKLYVKITPTRYEYLTYVVMSFVVALSMRDYYLAYDGRWKTRDIPIIAGAEKKARASLRNLKSKRPKGGSSPKVYLPELFSFKLLRHVMLGGFEGYAYTTFQDAKELIKNPNAITKEDVLEFCRMTSITVTNEKAEEAVG